jgi:hypothetical protein
MGNGSPRLQRTLALCALPVLVGAALVRPAPAGADLLPAAAPPVPVPVATPAVAPPQADAVPAGVESAADAAASAVPTVVEPVAATVEAARDEALRPARQTLRAPRRVLRPVRSAAARERLNLRLPAPVTRSVASPSAVVPPAPTPTRDATPPRSRRQSVAPSRRAVPASRRTTPAAGATVPSSSARSAAAPPLLLRRPTLGTRTGEAFSNRGAGVRSLPRLEGRVPGDAAAVAATPPLLLLAAPAALLWRPAAVPTTVFRLELADPRGPMSFLRLIRPD